MGEGRGENDRRRNREGVGACARVRKHKEGQGALVRAEEGWLCEGGSVGGRWIGRGWKGGEEE